MRYVFEFKPRAVKELTRILTVQRRRILARIEQLADGLKGDIKRLTDFTPEYRLRVGNYRVLFEIDRGKIEIYRVCHRREAYD